MACQENYLLIEPFNSGSHKQLIDVLLKQIPGTYAVTLPGKKWQWKARTSALYLSQIIPRDTQYRSVFASSVLNLAELVALRPDLAHLHKVVYFHENQLQYPVRKHADTDFQYGYNQILTCLVADTVLFNSKHNMESFLDNIRSFLKLIPYERPKNIAEQLRPKCHVLHFPIEFPRNPKCTGVSENIRDRSEDMEITGDQKITREKVKDPVEATKHKNSYTHSQDTVNKPVDCTANVDSDFPSRADASVVHDVDSDSKNRGGPGVVHDVSVEGTSVETCKTSAGLDYTDVVSGDTSRDSASLDCVTELSNSVLEEPGVESSQRKRVKYGEGDNKPLHIVWPHRWEHDKGPETFFQVMFRLQEAGLQFRLSVLGEDFLEKPGIFEEAAARLQDEIEHWGFLHSRDHYYTVLREADCVVSTANHEFFGVAMLEAVHLGCYPLCPNRLVYPEIFPKEYLYSTDTQLFKRLRELCRRPHLARQHTCKVDTSLYTWKALEQEYTKHITQASPQHG